MAKYIAKLGKMNPDAIQTAMESAPLSAVTIQELKVLSEAVRKAPKSTARDRRTPETDFLQFVVPLIERVINENRGNPQGLRIDAISGINVVDVSKYTIEQLREYHSTLVAQESSLKTRLLIIRLQRGLVYLRLHELMSEFDDVQGWISEHYHITYGTATAYMSVAALIKRYPILLKCGLSFEQIRRHNKRLSKFLSSQLEDDVCGVCDISDGGKVTAAVQTDPHIVQVPDCASKDADFELVQEDDRQADEFPFFEDLGWTHE